MNKILSAAAAIMLLISCNNQDSKTTDTTTTKDSVTAQHAAIKEENVDYKDGNVTLKGFVAYPETKGVQPVVLIAPEWWGISDYTRKRARELAGLGYLAFAIDPYGDGKNVDSPEEAQKLAGPFYKDLNLGKSRFEAALNKIKTYPNADTTRIGAIGYCFGGSMVLNMARLGEPLKGVVSFHGNLVGAPADKNLLKAEILVCHGDSDKFVLPAEVTAFKKQMDSIGAKYTFKSYAGATHAFTNPAATEKGKKYNMPIAYNAAADTASFNEMKVFFERVFK